jgi:hypothetical protein
MTASFSSSLESIENYLDIPAIISERSGAIA